MSFNYKALGGLFTFRYINDVEDMDVDDLQEVYAEMEEEYQGMKDDCKELQKELNKLKEVIERKNPEVRREKIKSKLETEKAILHNEDVPYEVRMRYIIDAYRKDQKKWGKLAEYAKHLEREVVRLKEILISNGYTDSGASADYDPAEVICKQQKKIKQLEKICVPKEVKPALVRVRQLENIIGTFPLKAYKAQSFSKVIKSQEIYIKELQALLDKNGVEYHPKIEVNKLEIDGVDKVMDELVRYGNSFKPSSFFLYSPRQSMRLNIFKSVTASWPQVKELVNIVYSMMCDQEVYLRTHLYRGYLACDDSYAVEQVKITKFAAFAPCATFCDGKARENVTGLTDLCYLDFDNIKDEKLIDDAMYILRKDKYVLLASRSVSGEGLHVLIPYSLKDMEQSPRRETMTTDEMQDLYANIYKYMADKYQEKLGLMPDYQANHMERLYIISYDSELYYNPNAETMVIDLKKPTNIENIPEFEPRLYKEGEKEFEVID